MSIEQVSEGLRELLLRHRNGDGGWAYYAGKKSRIEPTCWALLSILEGGRPDDVPLATPGLNLLVSWQRQDGLIAEPHLPPNMAFNGLASLLLSAVQGSPLASAAWGAAGERLQAGVLKVESTTTWNLFSPIRQDNSLVGWPWTEDAFGWVEPTSLCTLALKKSSIHADDSRRRERIDRGEKLLLDRSCAAGGWNYGNPEVLEQKLRAYVPPTALALLALADKRDRPEVRKGLEFLEQAWRREPSGMALGLARLCLRSNGGPLDEIDQELCRAYDRSAFLGNLSVTGLVRYAAAAGNHGPTSLSL